MNVLGGRECVKKYSFTKTKCQETPLFMDLYCLFQQFSAGKVVESKKLALWGHIIRDKGQRLESVAAIMILSPGVIQ